MVGPPSGATIATSPDADTANILPPGNGGDTRADMLRAPLAMITVEPAGEKTTWLGAIHHVKVSVDTGAGGLADVAPVESLAPLLFGCSEAPSAAASSSSLQPVSGAATVATAAYRKRRRVVSRGFVTGSWPIQASNLHPFSHPTVTSGVGRCHLVWTSSIAYRNERRVTCCRPNAGCVSTPAALS